MTYNTKSNITPNRTYYSRVYHLVILLLLSGFGSLLLGYAIQLIKTSISGITQQYFDVHLTFLQHQLSLLGIISLVGAFLLMTIEIIDRLRHDSILNLVKSISQTIQFCQFFIQEEAIQPTISTGTQTNLKKVNITLKRFNQAISKSIVDIRQDYIIVIIKCPKTQQAQKLLEGMELDIKAEISLKNPDYYFSPPTRTDKELWFIGKRK